MSIYEVAILYDPDLEVDLSKAEDRVVRIFTNNGGQVKSTDNWGKRKLAYPIKKNEHAIYVFYTVDLEPSAINKINEVLNITDEVIRFLITKPDFKAITKADNEKTKKAKQAAKQSSSIDDSDEAEKDNEG